MSLTITLTPTQIAQLRSQLHYPNATYIPLRMAREESEMSQDVLAEKAGCSRVYISQLENDEVQRDAISLRLARRIAFALGYTLDQLFPETP